MLYSEMKVNELRNMCSARGLATSGVKALLISRLEKSEREKPQEILIKQEPTEMQMDVPIIHHHQHREVSASPHISHVSSSHETFIKSEYEHEPTNGSLQSMNTEEIQTQQSIEQHPIDVTMSIDDQSSTSSVPSSPIVNNIEVSSSINNNNNSIEHHDNNNNNNNNNNDQSKLFDSSEKTTYQKDDLRYEIDRELLNRLISERKYGTQKLNSLRMYSRSNQGQSNGVPYNYDLLLDIVQKSEIYNDGEIPDWLRYYYDATYYECVRNVGIPVEELFRHDF